MVDVRDSAIQGVRIGVNQYINSVESELDLTIPGTYEINAARVVGCVRLIQAQVQFTRVTTINGVTDVWSDLWDGTVSDPVTKSPGADLSAAQVGTTLFKSQGKLFPFEVLLSDRGRTYECTGPFCAEGTSVVMNAKNGADTFLRVILTIGGPLDAAAIASFTWEAYPQGRLELLTFP